MFSSTATLCLLVDAFNPFTFKVIINMCDPITIFLIVWALLSVGFAGGSEEGETEDSRTSPSL